jgi:acyl dehydratase
MESYHSVAELEAAVGQEIGPTDWFEVDQQRVNGFADDTEDHQWIHVDPERAAKGPFGGPVAHGFLTLSLIPYFSSQLRTVDNVTMGVNYGLDRVRFPAPVRMVSRYYFTSPSLTPTP